MALAGEVEAAGGTLSDLGFTSDLIELLKAIGLNAGGNAYSQLYAGYYPGAYKRWGSDPDRLDVIYDLSRKGRHFYSNNSDSKRPFWVGGQVASQPVTRHDANKGWMRTFWAPPAQPHVMFTLFRPTGGTSSLDFVLTDTIRARRNASSSVWVDGYGYGSVPAVDNEWTSFAVRCEHALGSQGWKVWGNGMVIRNDTPYGSGAGSSDLRVGGTFDQGAPVDIALVLYYAVSLTDAEIVAIDSAIQAVYAGGAADTQPPSVPTGLASTAVTATSFTLSWSASTDDVGVTGYEVFRDGISIATPTGTSVNLTGLNPATTYAMTVRARDAVPNWSAQSSALNVMTTSDPQSPYGGTRWPLPGRVEAEDFDVGGEGVAFHDTSGANEGGGYRSEAVDMEACGEGGYNVGWTQTDEWLEYSVTVGSAGA